MLDDTKNHITIRRMMPLLVIASILQGLILTGTGSASSQSEYHNAYVPVPKVMLVDGEILFTRLNNSQLSHVRITPAEAARIGKVQAGAGAHSRVVFESLGGYVNKNQIIHDWVGTKSFVPKEIPAYIVRVSGVTVPSLGPVGGVAGHFWNVIVNATNGRTICLFSYD